MSTELITTEITKVIDESGLEKTSSLELKEKFLPFFDQAEQWKEKAESLIVTDALQTDEMKQAREARLALKAIRVEANKTRKELKEESLRYGKAVQGVYNVIEYLIVPIEKHLEDQEKFVERQEQKKKAEVKIMREEQLSIYSEFVPYGIDLAGMTEDDYQKLLSGAKLQYRAKLEEEQRIEFERIKNEKLDKLENERRIEVAPYIQFVDGARDLRNMEADDYESFIASLKAAKREYEEEQEQIRKEKEELEAKLKEKEEQERKEEALRQKEIKAKAREEQKVKKASDKDKLINFALMLHDIKAPELKSDKAKQLMVKAMNSINDISVLLAQEAEEL